MHKRCWCALILWACATSQPGWSAEGEAVTPPKRIEYDNRRLAYNPAWKDKETTLVANLDGDADEEVLISFVATYKEEKEEKTERDGSAFDATPKRPELRMLQNYAFFQIYDKGTDGAYHASKTFTGMDQIGSARLIPLEPQGPPGVALFSPGGEKYTDLAIYQWREGGYRLVFNKGSSVGMEIVDGQTPARIRVGQKDKGTDGPPEWEEYAWDPQARRFVAVQQDL